MFKLIKSLFSVLWRILEILRNLFWNFFFLLLVVGILVGLFSEEKENIVDGSALVLSLQGELVEQLSIQPSQQIINKLIDSEEDRETLMKDVLDALRIAKDDDSITTLYLDLQKLSSGSLSKLQEIRAAIHRFKQKGKKVIAAGDFFTQPQYFLAATADEVYLHPFGGLFLEGFQVFGNYFKEGLGRLGIKIHVFRVGEYKSASESLTRNEMSPEAKENNKKWLTFLWDEYKKGVAEDRKIAPQQIQNFIDSFPEHLKEAKGRASLLAKNFGLVDNIYSRDMVVQRMIKLVGQDNTSQSFRKVAYKKYLKARESLRHFPAKSSNKIAVIVARGNILYGNQPPGKIGGNTLSKMIRTTANRDEVKAIILRIDSGGGIMQAAEIIRREVELARKRGIPVIASFSSVAASGGYWIALPANEIWASASSITGSIGIFGIWPDVSNLAGKLGIHSDGIGTTKLAGAFRPDRPLQPIMADSIQLIMEDGYRSFVERVAEGRNMSLDAVEKVARGQVWSGKDALKFGLVDHLGTLEDAIRSAAEKTSLGSKYEVEYIREEVSLKEKLLLSLRGIYYGKIFLNSFSSIPVVGQRILSLIQSQIVSIADFSASNGIYAHCLCQPH